MIRALIVDDSAVMRHYLRHIMESEDDFEVVGMAVDGVEAVEMAVRLKPDVITMDVHMPRMDGYEATRAIMSSDSPIPIVIVSATFDSGSVEKGFKALEAGALTGLSKPVGLGREEHTRQVAQLVQTIRLMSEVKVVRRRPARFQPQPAPAEAMLCPRPVMKREGVVAVGASTGGPIALRRLLSALTPGFGAPVLVVQHIADGFIDGMAGWLAEVSGMKVCIADSGQLPEPGRVYLAPGGFHLALSPNGRVALNWDDAEHGCRPSVSYLFRSLASQPEGVAAAVLLTGMGRDGAQELKLLREAGCPTFAQDSSSSVVHGMPGEAISLGGADHIMSPEEIGAALSRIAPHVGGDEK